MRFTTPLTLAALAAFLPAQSVIVPQQAASTDGIGATGYPFDPCFNPTCSNRVQYFYTRNAFLNQGVTTPIAIHNLRWRGDGGLISPGGLTIPNVQVELSTATPGAILGPNSVFAQNHGPDRTVVFLSGPVTTLPLNGSSPNGFLCSLPIALFVYDPNAGDLCVDIVNTNGPAGVPWADFLWGLGVDAARVWDFTPNATQELPASGNNQPGMAIVMEVGYGPAANFATAAPYGTGCYDLPGSFYEDFALAPAFDLNNSALTMIFNGNGYLVLPGITSFVAPGPAAVTIANGDDVEQAVTLASALPVVGGVTAALTVCSNGFVSTAPGNGTPFSGSGAVFMQFPQTCWANWHDFDPLLGGAILFEEIGNVSYVTWQAVADFGGGGNSTFQYQFDRSTGMVHMVWQTMSALGTTGYVTGFKVGSAIRDPGSRDISATLAATFSTGPDVLPLTIGASARPRLGTLISLDTTNCGAAAVGANILSFTRFNPGLSLAPFGMPGCQQFAGLDVVRLFVTSGSTGSSPFPVPGNPVYAGVHVYSQATAFVSGFNSLGVIASNGLDLKLDQL